VVLRGVDRFRQMKECGIEFLVMDDTTCVWVDDSRIGELIRKWFDSMDDRGGATGPPGSLATPRKGLLRRHRPRP